MQVMQAIGRVSLLLGLMVLASSFHVGQSNCQNSSLVTRGIPSQVNVSVEQLCDAVPGMTQKQSDFCEKYQDLMTSIMHGARLAMQECQYQFQNRRWNCSVQERGNNTLFHLLKGKGTREAAFTYAIASAAVTHSIARACVQGNVTTCGCSPDKGRPKKYGSDFHWGGCGDNIEAGVRFARKFMIAGEASRAENKALTLMNVHNIETGIQVVRENSQLQCQCHGIATACALKSCWRQLAGFRDIAKILFGNYENAVHVRSARGKALKILDKWHRRPSRRPAIGSMVYLKRSPNYCNGTVGRVCDRDSDRPGNCELLCCGRGFRSVRVAITEQCKCKFHWCCYVKCEECTRYEMRDTCR